MDPSLIIQVIGLLIAISGLIVIVYWLRMTRDSLERHRDALEGANRISAEALEAAREANEIARNANLQNREVMQEQLKLSAYPHLHADLENVEGNQALLINNPGMTPAFDVQVLVVAQYLDSELPLRDFLRTYVVPQATEGWLRARDLEPESIPGIHYGVVYERRYRQFAAGRRVQYNLNLPVLPMSLYIFMQYESMLGENYASLSLVSTLAPPTERARSSYRVVYRKPQGLLPVDRLDVFEVDGRWVMLPEGNYILSSMGELTKLIQVEGAKEKDVDVDRGKDLPPFLQDDIFVATLKYAMPARYLKREFGITTDRDRWSDVSEPLRTG